jgi:hypothetical protein
VRDVEHLPRLDLCTREIGQPVVREKDLPLAAAVAEEPQAPARHVDVVAPDADHLVHAHACRNHQGDRQQRCSLVRTVKHPVAPIHLVDSGLRLKAAQQMIEFMGRHDPGKSPRSSRGDARADPRVRAQQPTRAALRP